MRPKFIEIIKNEIKKIAIILLVIFIVVIIVYNIITNLNFDSELSLIDSEVYNVPIIKNEMLEELAELYSTLNEKFEREIDNLVNGTPNRKNKSNNNINRLTHYGVNGKENKPKFINDDYIDGINISYVKNDGESNFNDIISAMSVLYSQMMDTKTIEELKESFERLFWLSHTYTFDSSELYPCKSGCSSINNYRCTDLYKDYMNTNLKYSPFIVKAHDLYDDFNEDTDFKIVLPVGKCIVHGENGGGCILDETKICYHSSEQLKASTVNNNLAYELGEEVFLGYDEEKGEILNEDVLGYKINKNSFCNYYQIVKYCETREDLNEKIEDLKQTIISSNESFAQKENPSESAIESHEKQIEEYEDKLEEFENELSYHIENECSKDNTYWCNGFKICKGHKNHYKCNGHKIVVCFGHTDITVNINILYGDDLLNAIYN